MGAKISKFGMRIYPAGFATALLTTSSSVSHVLRVFRQVLQD